MLRTLAATLIALSLFVPTFAQANCQLYRVVLASQPGCPACNQARALFQQYGIAYDDYHYLNPQVGYLFRRMTPVIRVVNKLNEDVVILGFNEGVLRQKLCLP
jgi:Glutaredoxin